MLVGLFGLSSSLGAIVLARRREFGVLRHLGLTRAQIRAMLAAEGGLLALRRRRRGPGARARRSAWCWSTSSIGSRSTGAWSSIRRTLLLLSLVAVLVALAILTAHRLGTGSDGHGTGARGARGLVSERRAFLGFGLLPLAALGEPVRYPAVTPDRKLVFPRDHGAHPEYRVEWWYVTGWLAIGPARVPDHLLPRAAGGDQRQPEPIQSAADPVRARRAQRSEARPAAARPARGARRLLARARRARPHRRVDRRLAPGARRPPLRGQDRRRASSSSTFALFATPARPAGRSGLQPQGPPAGGGELLLQPPAAQRRRQAERPGRRGHGVARPRMVERLPGAGGRGLGLVRHQLARRRLADGFPDARARRAASTTRRPAFRSSRCGPGNRRAPASSIRWRWQVNDLRAGAADGRPGARLARQHRHDLLGRRGARVLKDKTKSGAATSSSPATGSR